MDYENEEAMSSPLWKKWIEDYTSFKIFLKTFCTPTYFASLWWWASSFVKRRLHVRVRNGKKSSKLFDRRRRKVFPRCLLVVNSWYWASICKGKYIAETVWKKTSYSLSKPFSLVANSSVVIIFYFIWATFLSYNARSSVLRRTCISNCVFPLFPRKLSTIFCLVYSLPCDLEI